MFKVIANNVLVDIEIFQGKQTDEFTFIKVDDGKGDRIRACAMYEGEQIGEFDFIKVDAGHYADEDVAIFKKEFRRKGIYSFVIDCVQFHYNVKIVPSKFLTAQGRKFWKKRKSTFNAGDNVLIPQTADEKDNPKVNAVVKQVKEFELIVEVDNSFTLPVPKKYCIKL